MDDSVICDVETTMKYVVRGESAVFYAGEREKSYWPVDERRADPHVQLFVHERRRSHEPNDHLELPAGGLGLEEPGRGVRQALHQRRGAVVEPDPGGGGDVPAGHRGGADHRRAQQGLGATGD